MTTLQIAIPDGVRVKAQKAAREKHLSLNEFATFALVRTISDTLSDSSLRKRAKRGSLQRFKEILAGSPNVPPERHDMMK